jgi:hypothetical protein
MMMPYLKIKLIKAKKTPINFSFHGNINIGGGGADLI